MEGFNKSEGQIISFSNHVRFKEFWKIIDDPKNEKSDLKSIKELKEFINPKCIDLQDQFKRTLLHYAVLRKDDRCIIFLLENGASFVIKDIFKRTPLMDMPKSAFEKFLDNMVSFEGELTINFEKLLRIIDGEYSFPTDWIYKIKKEKHLQELIQHPVIQLLIFFKWMNCQNTNVVSVFFYSLFFLAYLIFIIFIESRNSLFNSKSCEDGTIAKYTLSGLMWLSIGYFAFFDLFKIVYAFKKIKQTLRNILLWLRWLTFALAIVVTACTDKCTFEFYCIHIEALRGISVLITSITLYFTFIQTPRFAFYGKIFVHTFLQVLVFFVVHSILIIGYAMTFFILIYSSNGDLIINSPFDAKINGTPTLNVTEGEDTEFDNPGLAIFKTFVMFASEFDASDIPFERNSHFVATRIVFISYIFVITVVLFNILVGVTFSEVNKVNNNKALYDSLAFIDVIINFEENRYFYKVVYFFFPNFELKKQNDLPPKVVIRGNQISARLKFDFGGRVVVFQNSDFGHTFWYYVNVLFLYNKMIVPIVKKSNEIVAKKVKL